jgi:hypothetical protein
LTILRTSGAAALRPYAEIPCTGRSEDRPVHGTQEKKQVPRCARDDSFILIFCFFVLVVCLERDLMRELRLGLMWVFVAGWVGDESNWCGDADQFLRRGI